MYGRKERSTYRKNLYEKNDLYYHFLFFSSYISFCCRFMSKTLSDSTYIYLLMINIPLAALTGFTVGTFLGHSENLDTALLRLDLTKQNRSKIFEYIKSNCSQLMIEYPEFDTFPKVELCHGYHLGMNFGKLVIVFSTFYNVYLLYRLYSVHRLSTVIIGILSTFLLYVKFINDQWILQLVESTMVSIGFSIVIGHYVLSTYSKDLKQH